MSVRLSGPPACAAADRLDSTLLKQRAARLLRAVGCSRSELSLVLVDDTEMAELNQRYRARPGATDVLSFSLLEGEYPGHRGKLLGDVVVSLETAASQARRRHRGLNEEVARLAIHGLLHLLGHDHEEETEERAMRAEERRLWRAISQ